MVDVTPLLPPGRQYVESYGAGRFRVSGQVHEGSILLFPEQVLPWAPASAAALDEGSLAEVLAAVPRVELLLLGCGEKQLLLPGALRRAWRAQGLLVEVMATGAACRTYNVLMAEDRRVAAALIAVA